MPRVQLAALCFKTAADRKHAHAYARQTKLRLLAMQLLESCKATSRELCSTVRPAVEGRTWPCCRRLPSSALALSCLRDSCFAVLSCCEDSECGRPLSERLLPQVRKLAASLIRCVVRRSIHETPSSGPPSPSPPSPLPHAACSYAACSPNSCGLF